jgi:hypothetical protein
LASAAARCLKSKGRNTKSESDLLCQRRRNPTKSSRKSRRIWKNPPCKKTITTPIKDVSNMVKKKNKFQMLFKRLGLIGITAWLYFPTGTPDDIVAFSLIAYLGTYWYAIGGIIIIAAAAFVEV